MKAKKKSAHAKPTAAAEPDPGRAVPTLAGLPIDAAGLNDLMRDLASAAKMESDPVNITRTLIARLTGDPNRK